MQQRPHTVTGPVPMAAAHAARPSPRHRARLAALGAVVLVAIGLGFAVQRSSSAPVRSTPSSALYMTEDAVIDATSSARHR